MPQRPPAPPDPSAAAPFDDRVLVGRDPMRGLLDVQALRGGPGDPARVRLYVRDGEGRLQTREEAFHPFVFLSDRALLDGFDRARYRIQSLRGEAFFRHVVAFDTFGAYHDALRHVERRAEVREKRPDELYRVGSPAVQYLMQTGRTCFKGMDFADLHRLQLDIEVASDAGFPNAERPDDEVIIVALSDSRGWQQLLDARTLGSEEALLRATLAAVAARDPDVIEGHNCLLPGTRLWTADGRALPVAETPPLRVLGASGAPQPSTGVRSRPFEGTAVELVLERCGTLATTVDHPHLVASGATTAWRPAGEVCEGDYLAAPRTVRFDEEDDALTADDYYAAGLIWSDGHIPPSPNLVWFSNTDAALLDWMRGYMGPTHFEKHRASASPAHAPLSQICLSGTTLRERLAWIGVPQGNKLASPVDFSRVVRAPRAKAMAFLRGLIDGDGHVRPHLIHVASASPSCCAAVQMLAARFGLSARISPGSVVLYPTHDSADVYDEITSGLVSPHKRIRCARDRDIRDDVPGEVAALLHTFVRPRSGRGRAGDDWRPGYDAFPLPRSTVNDILNGRTRVSRASARLIVSVIASHVVDAPAAEQKRWNEAKRHIDGLCAFSWLRVRSARAMPHEGPVYTTTTEDHTFVANGVLTHNCYAFDLPYLDTRCARYGIPFALGRDGSAPRVYPAAMRFAERSVEYPAYEIAGRHVVDTMFLAMSYDVGKRDLPGYGLKAVARYFGFAPEGRTYVDGDQIARTWREDPERLLAYALDDVTETERLSRHLSGASFYLTQMLPMPYGQAARTGPAAKIEALFVREYLRRRQSIPKPQWGSQSVGGYTDVFVTGIAGPIVYADVESLYPSIMLGYDVRPATDTLRLFPGLLHRLRDLRMTTKRAARDAETAEERSSLDARQAAYKVLINSFYGYLGFGFASFNDVAEADRVAATGQELLRAIIAAIRSGGGTVVEVDTDGVLFEPPPGVTGEAAERAFVEAINDVLPGGIHIAYEGRAAKMLSYKKKNYALLGYDGVLKFKGSSLVSRSIERFGRAFVREAVELLLSEDIAGLHALYVATRDRILRRQWPHGADDFSRTETLKDSVDGYRRDVEAGKRARAASYELAIARAEATGVPVRVGDRVSYYVTGSAPGVTTYDNSRWADAWRADGADENTTFYLKRLDEFARKFEVFFSDTDFRQVFSPPDLFGFDARGIRLLRLETAPDADPESVPF